MLYLLDANVLITAHDQYYPIDRVPEFWDWLVSMAEEDQVKIPIEILEEIKEAIFAGNKIPSNTMFPDILKPSQYVFDGIFT